MHPLEVSQAVARTERAETPMTSLSSSEARSMLDVLLRSEKGMSFGSVLLIMLVLSTTAVTGYLATVPVIRVSQTELTFKRMETLRSAIVNYRKHNGSNPPSLDALVSSATPCSVNFTTRELTGWCGPYVDRPVQQASDEFKKDGWGTIIELTPTSLRSWGENRTNSDGDDILLSI